MSDAALTSASQESVSDAPVEELYRRHRSAVLSYARTCCRDPHTAEDLVSEAFARTLQAVRAGGGPQYAWRPYLLTTVRRIAVDWADAARRTELSPEFDHWLTNLPDSPQPESAEDRLLRQENNSLVIRAFRSMPERWQAVLWHTAVEDEPATTVGALLGLSASGVGSLASRAREGLREAYLRAHVESTTSEECRRYSSLLGAAIRRTGGRPDQDLHHHLSRCPHCRNALLEHNDLNERLGMALSTKTLLCGGSAYAAARMIEARSSTSAAATASSTPNTVTGRWPWTTKSSLRSVGGVITTVGLAIFILPMPFHDKETESLSSQVASKASPTVTDSRPPATPPPSSRPPATPSPSRSMPADSAEPSAPASGTAPGKPDVNHERLRTITWTGPLRNAGIDSECVGTAGTAVVQNTCDSSWDQIWQVVAFKSKPDYGWLRNAATGECIDYGEATHSTGFDDVVDVAMRPCHVGGEGQLFGIQGPWGEGGFRVHAEIDDTKPWDEMQLGMLDWWEGNDPPPERNARVVLTYHYYNASRLHYLMEGLTKGPSATS